MNESYHPLPGSKTSKASLVAELLKVLCDAFATRGLGLSCQLVLGRSV